jgi:hypothetical protein
MSCEQRGHATMSGKKRITVDESAWQSAMAAASKLRDVNAELPGMLDAVRRDGQAQIERARTELGSRQDALEQSLAGLSEQTRRLEAATSRRIRDKTAMLWNEVKDASAEIRATTRQALEEQEARQRERDVQDLRNDLDVIRRDKDRALSAATQTVADARLLFRAIDEQLPHNQFAPGQLADAILRLDQADGNISQGHAEAALSRAQDVYFSLSKLRTEVELRDQEWRIAQVAAVSATSALLEQISYNENLEVTDAEGRKLDGVTLDVDFWSDGELGELRARAEELSALIKGDQPDAGSGQPRTATLTELRAVVEREVPELNDELTAVVGRAGARQFASQVRVNLAEFVVEALEDATGFVWQEGDATYAGDDPRQAFYSKLRHPDDSEIVVEVAPDEDGQSCVLRLMSYDKGVPDEDERSRRAHVVADRLRGRGLQIGSPTADPGQPDPSYADFDRLRLPSARRPVGRTRRGRGTAQSGARQRSGTGAGPS